ncbi:MAG: hypothetical protein ACOCQB_01360 [Halanaerobiaceae bacterium]
METLYIIVEGNDDERFFRGVMKNELLRKYDRIKIWQHAQRSHEDKEKFFRAVQTMQQDYIYIEDLDDVPTPSRKKKNIIEIFNDLDRERVVIVVKEIEGWYLAGLNRESCECLGLDYLERTDDIYKEDFNEMIPHHFRSRIDFMQEIIKEFSLKTGVKKNRSLSYFVSKFLPHR